MPWALGSPVPWAGGLGGHEGAQTPGVPGQIQRDRAVWNWSDEYGRRRRSGKV